MTWSSATEGDADSADVYQQRYDRNGRAIGGEERINTTTGGAQTRNFVTPLSDGGWLAPWLDDGQFYQQRYGSDGAREGSATPVTSGGTYFASSTVQLLDGGWVAASGTSLATGDVYLTRYNGSGSQVGATVLVSEAGWSMFPSTTALPDGGWVVTWTQDLDTIWQQRLRRQRQCVRFRADQYHAGREHRGLADRHARRWWLGCRLVGDKRRCRG
ncbi:MAG: immune inhibitor A, partial [Rhizobium sp.]|nr:immune inhibitor A [Rhizobium sp.]